MRYDVSCRHRKLCLWQKLSNFRKRSFDILNISCRVSLFPHSQITSSPFLIYRVRHKKQLPKKTYTSREQYNVNYSNLQFLLPRDITWDSENFIRIYDRKQKLGYSWLNWKVCFYNWTLVITATAIPKMRIKLIVWNSVERTSVL